MKTTHNSSVHTGSPQFIELDRWFVPVGKDKEPSTDFGRAWGPRLGGWLNWKELRKRHRVMLLAEAASGKSMEFRNQADTLVAAGEAAFYLRIEELADQGFDAALEPYAAKLFAEWRKRSTPAWFFLDSVDEARLNGKSLDTALKAFVRKLDQSLPRAHVFISCRVSDWRGREDANLIERRLPFVEKPANHISANVNRNLLLDPIFGPEKSKRTTKANESEQTSKGMLLVQLLPLSMEQCRKLAAHAGVSDVDSFAKEVERLGLDAYTERPGDVLDLAEYWKTFRRFSSLSDMVEHSINRKLQEHDRFRGDVLSLATARAGAERLAAALSLGKSFTLRAPGSDPDPSLAAGALDPAEILKEWNDAERGALLRRGIFAPATYGRIRFHHRSTQEYLAAHWLHHLLGRNCPRSEIWHLLFAERYSVQTVVPSLRPEAVWLSLYHPDFREEILRREPLLLIRHGDPRSLSLDVKERLLATYASRHAVGEISDDSLDNRSVAMFTEKRLGHAIQKAWNSNQRDDFRLDLLRLIRDGGISDCLKIARKVLRDIAAPNYHRIVALEAVKSLNDEETLSETAKHLIANASTTRANVASSFAKTLFPEHLDVSELFALIAKSLPPRKNTIEGFAYDIMGFYRACPSSQTNSFVQHLARLLLRKPYVGAHERISKRHVEIARYSAPIAIAEVGKLKGQSAPGLVQLLMAVERAGELRHDEEVDRLDQMVRDRPYLQRLLFWADVDEHRRNRDEVHYSWQIVFIGQPLWNLGEKDLVWLYEDLQARSREADRRVALSAIAQVLNRAHRLKQEAAKLRKLLKADRVLLNDLKEFLALPKADRATRDREKKATARKMAVKRRQQADKQSWIKFGRKLRQNPSLISSPKYVKSWESGAYRLKHLSHWLQKRTNGDEDNAHGQWRLLEEGFGRKVAEAYRDGMKRLWRLTPAKAPVRAEGGGVTTSWMTILAYNGIHIEAIEDPEWATVLSPKEAKRAAQHGCISEQGYPEWLDDLIVLHPKAVLPVLRKSIEEEWQVSSEGRSDLIYRYANSSFPILPALGPVLFDVLTSNEPKSLSMLDRGLRILRNLSLTLDQRQELLQLARTRFCDHLSSGKNDFAIRYLALVVLLDADHAVDDLEKWIESVPEEARIKAERILALLFDRNHPLATGVLTQVSVLTLERLLHLAYSYIQPKDDVVHEGMYTDSDRDNAENARNSILTALLERPGADAFGAMQRVSEHPTFAPRAIRFKELLKSKAERDSEISAWSVNEVLTFEDKHTTPIKTGVDLLNVVMGVLADVQHALTAGDVTSRPLLERAKNEEEVQNWVVEQINFRSRGRFHAHREPQVASGNMPDIIVSSTSAPCQVAIEVKHGGKGWSFTDLEYALRNQLAEDYLKVAERRHGILLVSHHKQRNWIDRSSGKRFRFENVIDRLCTIATELIVNANNDSIEVRCCGIDASSSVAGPTAKKAGGGRRTAKRNPNKSSTARSVGRRRA